MTDCCSKEGALALCEKIEAHWKARGYFGIKTRLEEFKIPWQSRHKSEDVLGYAVRTNIGANGFPPKEAEQSVYQY